MPIRELKAAAGKYKATIEDDDFKRNQAANALLAQFNTASDAEMSEFLLDDPEILRNLVYRPELELQLIQKVSPQALNQAIAFLTHKISDPYKALRYCLLYLLSNRHSSSAVLEALLNKADLELLMEQQRKIPYNAFLLTVDAGFNEVHEAIIFYLGKIAFDDRLDLHTRSKANYCLGSIALTLSSRYPEKPFLFLLAYNYMHHLEDLTPMLKAHPIEKIKSAISHIDNDKENPKSAAYLIMAAQHLEHFDKKKDKKTLVSILKKLNQYAIPRSKYGSNGAAFHVLMAEVFASKHNLVLFSKRKSLAMIEKALSHAEIARDEATRQLHQPREGLNVRYYEKVLAEANTIIGSIRSGYQGQFPSEEKNTKAILTAMENKIINTAWIVRNPLATYPAHVKLVLKEIEAYKLGKKSGPSALRTAEKIFAKAASHDKLLRDRGTKEFYQAMVSSKSRNDYLLQGAVQHRHLLFNQNREAQIEDDEPGAMPDNRP